MAEMNEENIPTTESRENAIEAETQTGYGGWKTMPYVVGNETFEKLGTTGASSNLLVYLTTIFHMESVTAVTLLNVVYGTTNLAPVLGAFISDAYLGRYWTLGVASIISFTGMLILTLTAAISTLHPPHCEAGQACTAPTPLQLVILFLAFLLLVIGAGGIRPCNLAFGADQFNPKTESGRRGLNSFFNWYYLTLTFAIMVSSTVIVYIQSNLSWALGFGIPTFLMFLSCVVFFMGTRIYVKVRPEGSPFTSFAQVLVAAFRKRGLKLPSDSPRSLFNPPYSSSLNSKLPYTDQFRFLDKAAIIKEKDIILPNGIAIEPWKLCSLQQIEEAKCLLRVIPVWSTGIIYFVSLLQQSTYVVYGALQSDRHLGNSKFEIPAASFTIFSMVTLTIWIPIYDRVIVPWFKRMTGQEGGITLLQRMGIGIIISILAMVVSGLVEERRRSYALHKATIGTASYGGAISSMSSLWLIPQLSLLGLSEAFNIIGQVEFYYKQFPENMRSVSGSLAYCSAAISNYLSGLMVSIIHQSTGGGGRDNWLARDLNKGRLDNFYFFIAILGVINFIYFIMCARWYRYKGLDGGLEISLEETESKVSPV